MTEIFRQTLQAVARDRVVDSRDLQALRQAAAAARQQAPGSADDQMATQVMAQLNAQTQQINVDFTVPAGQALERYQFVLTPTYSESDEVPGHTPMEQVSHLSQTDALSETQQDIYRCGAASLLNAYLLLGGRFDQAAQAMGLPAEQRQLTYGNVHRVQERLFVQSDRDGQPGLTSSYTYQQRADGAITQVWAQGEMLQASQRLGLRLEPLVGTHHQSRYQRQGSVDQFWRQHPQGVLQVGVRLDAQSGQVSPSRTEQDQNHFVLIKPHGNQWVMVDSAAANNGNGSAARVLSPIEYAAFVLNSPGSVNGLY